MKFTLHKKLAACCGYEIIRTSQLAYRDINAHLLALFKQLDINCVLDVGANLGQFANGLRRTGYRGLIVSFEPVTECYTQLKQQAGDNWIIYQYALGSEPQSLDLNVANKSVFSSFLRPNAYSAQRFQESAATSHTVRVEVKRLDDIFNDIITLDEPRVFLKLDTQGYDLEVLKGARQSLRYISGLLSEISCKAIYDGMPGHIDALKYIDELGYAITDIYPLAHDKRDLSLLEFDCVFRKRE